MVWDAAHFAARILDAAAGATLVLAVAWAALFFVRQPAGRQRVIEWAMGACVLAALLAWLPGMPRLALQLLPEQSQPARQEGLDIGLIKTSNNPGANRSTASQNALENVAGTNNNRLSAWWHGVTGPGIIVGLYLGGMATGAALLLLGRVLLRHMVRQTERPGARVHALWLDMTQSARRQAELRVAPAACSLQRPVVAGVWRPVVIVPEKLCRAESQQQLQAVLWHEWAHVQRGDPAIWTLASTIQILFFFHPLYWLLLSELRANQERLADAWAAHRVGSAPDYAGQLLLALRGQRHAMLSLLPALAAIRRPSEFYKRMEALLLGGDIQPKCSGRFSWGMGLLLLIFALAAGSLTLRGAPASANPTHASRALTISLTEQHGVNYLLAHQEHGGGWLEKTGPGVTALTLRALLQAGVAEDAPPIQHGLKLIASMHQPDGGYYKDSNPAYNTAIVVSTLAVFSNDRFKPEISAARDFLAQYQVNQKPALGSFYGNTAAPTGGEDAATVLEALRDSGLKPTDTAVRDSLKQIMTGNVNSDSAEEAERTDDAILRQYGSITYAGLKSMLYAGLQRDDARVRALLWCIRENYTLDINPGEQSARGQFYYYHTFAKALRAYGDDVIRDKNGIAHDWRQELAQRLTQMQRTDGSWVNKQSQAWLEGDPLLVTAYGVLALQEARK